MADQLTIIDEALPTQSIGRQAVLGIAKALNLQATG